MALLETIAIHPPLEGEWKCMCPPGHHPDARDFVQTDAQRESTHNDSRLRFLTAGIPSERYFCWRRPVLAPVSGEVIRIGNGWPDNESTSLWQAIRLWYDATWKFRPEAVNGRLDIRPNAGNHVMIRTEEGYIVFLAHLINGSITVGEGEQVSRGDVVGMLGNSGNSTMPHLHINLFDQMEDPFTAKVLPFAFTGYEALEDDGCWIEKKNALPTPGTFVKFLPSRAT